VTEAQLASSAGRSSSRTRRHGLHDILHNVFTDLNPHIGADAAAGIAGRARIWSRCLFEDPLFVCIVESTPMPLAGPRNNGSRQPRGRISHRDLGGDLRADLEEDLRGHGGGAACAPAVVAQL
jgi:hypothetical protein